MIYNCEKVIEEMKSLGILRSEAVALSKAADESRKVIIADQMNIIELQNPDKKMSEAKLDRLARCTQVYKDHLSKMQEYRKAMLQAESDYEAILANKSFLRDKNSNNTAKISQGIYE